MEYENPEIREGINTSNIHPLADFSWLVAAGGFLVVCIFGLAYLLAGWLLPYIPVEFENDLLAKHDIDIFITPATEPADLEIENYLQELTRRLAENSALAEFFSTHPDMQERINFLSGFEMTRGKLSPLPDFIS